MYLCTEPCRETHTILRLDPWSPPATTAQGPLIWISPWTQLIVLKMKTLQSLRIVSPTVTPQLSRKQEPEKLENLKQTTKTKRQFLVSQLYSTRDFPEFFRCARAKSTAVCVRMCVSISSCPLTSFFCIQLLPSWRNYSCPVPLLSILSPQPLLSFLDSKVRRRHFLAYTFWSSPTIQDFALSCTLKHTVPLMQSDIFSHKTPRGHLPLPCPCPPTLNGSWDYSLHLPWARSLLAIGQALETARSGEKWAPWPHQP